MINRHTSLLAALLHASGGEIIGAIRLQKIVYLLEQLGMGGEFWFSYHHYGPYSEDLAETLEYAEKLDRVITRETMRSSTGSYDIYRLAQLPAQAPASLGAIPWDKAKSLIQDMKTETSVVIELSATIHWLRNKERITDWRDELKIRKPLKATNQRIDRALTLLGRLGLTDADHGRIPIDRV